MSDWALAIAALAALAALLTLVQRILSGLGARVDAMGKSLADRIDQREQALVGLIRDRFDEAERRRVEGAALWAERLSHRDSAIDALRRELEETRRAAALRDERTDRESQDLRAWIAQTYVPREAWLEQAGIVSVKLDRIYQRCTAGTCTATQETSRHVA